MIFYSVYSWVLYKDAEISMIHSKILVSLHNF